MRRFLLPAVVLAVAIAASVLAGNANGAAEPDDPPDDTTTPALGTPLLNARRTPEWLRQPTINNLLDAAVRAPIESVGDAGFVCGSFHVNGEPVTEVASDIPFIPGEAQRLLVVAALDTVGTGPFTTEVVRRNDATITDEGVLEGDIWLIGGADPVLSTDAYISRFDDDRAFTSLRTLALATVDALDDEGITAIDGAVIGVDAKYGSFPQSLDNVWTPAEIDSGAVGVTAGLLVDNGLTSFGEDPADLTSDVRSGDAVVHAAGEFQALLAEAGLVISDSPQRGDAPTALSREPITSIESPPLSEIAARALLDATTAEMLWRELSVRGGSVDTLSLFLSVNTALIELGLLTTDDSGNFPKWDAAGLSLLNRARCATLAGVLDPSSSGLAADALHPVAASALADCAPSGLESLDLIAAARPEVTSMAGRAVASNGDIITFSVIANWLRDESGVLAPRGVCDGLLPSVLDAIAGHPAGPAIDELTPLDPAA